MGHFTFTGLCLLAMFLSLRGAECYTCPIDWLPKNGLCYKVFSNPNTWLDAELFCRKFKPGCRLASLHRDADSADLAEYISDYLKVDGSVWIGLNDPQKKRTWVWSDRSSSNYFSWNQGEPNNSKNKEYCVHLWAPTGYLKWNDAPCESLHPFLCQCKY
uniref:C-type lectin BML-2 n=1 Tax=Bungarus multicinctus TaxID=8616 RepID=LECM2_BUNMU|nr:RecName: Full=C-type lectin BML-2; Short=CTL; Flags: Precursor [Bungarus multicinctus]ABH05181.1 C-type lectin 2 [Bungarus multicinctus]